MTKPHLPKKNTNDRSNCWEPCSSKSSIAAVVCGSSTCSSSEASTCVSCVVACCTSSSDEHSNCWEAFSSKSSIVQETATTAVRCRTLSRNCDAAPVYFIGRLEALGKSTLNGFTNTKFKLDLAKPPWWLFPQCGPEAWRNDSVTGCCSVPSAIHHGTFVRSDSLSKNF